MLPVFALNLPEEIFYFKVGCTIICSKGISEQNPVLGIDLLLKTLNLQLLFLNGSSQSD